ncbi:MAG TPA: bifunctional 4-hydroxy-2-oxoglutarate aldolase/2-dehydro-3-deoxy-phosphogluconate aldolase [Candidatus Sumerlaeota bacterium]|nr:bifunctional 4-hydroxy-2-oxoglutarate aldolase/2-dehydro-3-deoxy-phosphogluconate aldolase [Candidatus Sumerlaeota bacterium]HPS02234.1 bifunctional 4-hydroxy-2-oxoglutarate aldolase/2-dehydro-3-deoxy-phosphogluconate aldolase [Candidatus Sumerlaeota bacterium]
MIAQRIEQGRLIPIIALDRAADAIPLCQALKAGGLEVAEITFRTSAAREALRLVAEQFPEFALGAGTVTTIEEIEAAKACGAQFAVAPGLNPRIVRRAQELDLPFFPGVCTPSDIEAALELGCTLLKFFPADAFGGLKTIKALHAPYAHRGVRFIPTGGISAANMADYLSHPAVAAVGGSWLSDKKILAAQDWSRITTLTREAVSLAARSR